MMDAGLVWLESTALSVWMRESPSIFAFPAILALHTVGLGFVAGIGSVVALRVLGLAPGVAPVELRRFLPAMWAGFWVNAASGVVLLIAYPTKALENPVFYVKLICIAIAIVLGRRLVRQGLVSEGAARLPALRVTAWGVLACWATAIVTGRLLAYTYTRLTQEF